MNIHIAVYKFKESVPVADIFEALKTVEQLAGKVPGIIDITTAKNSSAYSQGYAFVIFVRGESQAAIDHYRAHPDHAVVAATLDAMEDHAIGIDFVTK